MKKLLMVLTVIALARGLLTASVHAQNVEVMMLNKPAVLTATIPETIPASERAECRWYSYRTDMFSSWITEAATPDPGVGEETITVMKPDGGLYLWAFVLYDEMGNPSEWTRFFDGYPLYNEDGTPIDPDETLMEKVLAAGTLQNSDGNPLALGWDTDYTVHDVELTVVECEPSDTDGDGDIDAIDIQATINAALGL